MEGLLVAVQRDLRRAFGDAAVLSFPSQDVADGEVIARVLLHLRDPPGVGV
jgi:hypothetical protein